MYFTETETSSEYLNHWLNVTALEPGETRSPEFLSIKSYPHDHQGPHQIQKVKPLCSHLISEQEILAYLPCSENDFKNDYHSELQSIYLEKKIVVEIKWIRI